MQATRILSDEHRVIESVVAALAAAADRLSAGTPLRPAFFGDAVRFIRDFADGYHHAKEEGALFAAMGEHGMPLDDGPIGVMLYEHDRARDLTARLDEAAQRLAAGDTAAAADVVDYARGYGELLAQHIYKEDNILFPMAAQALAPQAQDDLLDAYARIEAEQQGRGAKQAFLELARSLCAEVGVDPDAPPQREVRLPCHAC